MKIFADNITNITLIRDIKSQNSIKVMYHQIYRLVKDRKLAIELKLGFYILANKLINVFPIKCFKKRYGK